MKINKLILQYAPLRFLVVSCILLILAGLMHYIPASQEQPQSTQKSKTPLVQKEVPLLQKEVPQKKAPLLKKEIAKAPVVVPTNVAKKSIAKAPPPSVPNKKKFKNNAEFVQALLPHAKAVGSEYGVDPKILIAHAAHETNWGRSIPKHSDGKSSYNLFGIRANSGQKRIKIKTHEYRRGQKRVEYASFRSYDNFAESFRDYIRLMNRNRFKVALKNGHKPSVYFSHLQKAGYATDPKYAKKLMGVYNHPSLKKIA